MTGVEPGITVRRDGLPNFLRERGDKADLGDPEGLCLLSGGIVARNLRERLAADGMAPVTATTIEALARDLVATQGGPATALDRPVRKRLVASVLETASDHDTPLGRFARRVPWDTGDVVDGVATELDDYHRCTDAGADADALHAVVDAVESGHPFAAETTRESVDAFGGLDRRLREIVRRRNAESEDRAFVSRSHLVATARECLDDWAAVTGDPEWVAVATVSALDNPTARFLLAIAEETPVVVFAGAGTAGSFHERLDAAGDVPVRRGPWAPNLPSAGAQASLSAATGNERTPAPGSVDRIAVPDRRREVEFALDAKRDGETALLVAPDAGEYETPLRDVALTRDRPYRVETRREVRTLPAFRAVAATMRLLGAAADGEVAPSTLVDPLRLGAVPPVADRCEEWPLPGAQVRTIEARLQRERPRTIGEWQSALAGEELAGVERFLEWAKRRCETPPAEGSDLRELVGDLGAAYAAAARTRPLRRIEGIAVETGRARAATTHPAASAGEIRADSAGAAYDWLVGPLDRAPSWEHALATLRQGAGSESHGEPPLDADAVEVVDAGNAHFRRADRVFVLGMAAGRFPRTPRRPSFLHRAVREALYRRRDTHPLLYLDGRAPQYERDVDAYEAALGVARERVTLLWPYKDDEGRDVAPSPFLDALSVPDERRRRVGLGEWVDLQTDEGGDRELEAPESPKELLRALAHLANRPVADGPDAGRLADLAEQVPPEDRERVRRRIDRFRRYREDDDE